MAYGLKVKNNNLEIQIDGTYVNYVYNGQSGSKTINGFDTVNLTVASKYPPIALIRPTGNDDRACGVFDYVYSAPNYTGIRFFGGQKAIGNDTCSFDYKIYTVTEEVNLDTHGLRIRSDEGRLIYDSSKAPFKILEVGTATMESTYTHASYTSPYYIFSPWLSGILGFASLPFQGLTCRLVAGLSKQSTTSVQGIWIIVDVLGASNMNFTDYQGTTFTLIICEPN